MRSETFIARRVAEIGTAVQQRRAVGRQCERWHCPKMPDTVFFPHMQNDLRGE